MVDPVTGGSEPETADFVDNTIVEEILQGENDHERWLQQVVSIATKIEAARRYYIELPEREPKRGELERVMEKFGKQAMTLTVIGEGRDYPIEHVDTVRDLAQLCGTYSTMEKDQSGDTELDLSEHILPMINDAYSFIE